MSWSSQDWKNASRRQQDPWGTRSSYETVSSIGSWSSTRTLDDILMPEPPLDSEAQSYNAKLNSIRRAWKRDIFDNTHVDWKTIEVVEMSEHDRDQLLRKRSLRCDTSRQRHAEILAQARMTRRHRSYDNTEHLHMKKIHQVDDNTKPKQTPNPNNVIRRPGHASVVSIDDEEMIDMIG